MHGIGRSVGPPTRGHQAEGAGPPGPPPQEAILELIWGRLGQLGHLGLDFGTPPGRPPPGPPRTGPGPLLYLFSVLSWIVSLMCIWAGSKSEA